MDIRFHVFVGGEGFSSKVYLPSEPLVYTVLIIHQRLCTQYRKLTGQILTNQMLHGFHQSSQSHGGYGSLVAYNIRRFGNFKVMQCASNAITYPTLTPPLILTQSL